MRIPSVLGGNSQQVCFLRAAGGSSLGRMKEEKTNFFKGEKKASLKNKNVSHFLVIELLILLQFIYQFLASVLQQPFLNTLN